MARKRRKVSDKHSSGKSKVGITLTSTGVDLLNEMAEKVGLSKSQLVEQMAKGYIALASTTAQKIITLEASEESKNQGAENKTIIGVVSSPEEVEEKTEEVSQQIPLETYETLKKELQAKDTRITELEKQLTQRKEEATAKDNRITELEQQLTRRKEEVTAKDNRVNELEQQLTQQQSQNQEERVAELEKRLFQQRTQATSQAKNYREIKKQINTKDRQITLLKSQMADLQRLATIGEAQLNKWRDRSFNS
ncbi:MAG: hypothetical protein WA865_00240 [Spirulinaceae cyanobacterium]